MDNILTYVKYRGDLSFKTAPFDSADATLFSTLIGLDFEDIPTDGITLSDLAAHYGDKIRENRDDERFDDKEKLLFEAGACERYRNVLMTDYVKDISAEDEMTFYAAVFKITPRLLFVVYRGTDGSLLSWKENFNCLYRFPTPGQLRAKEYLEDAVGKYKGLFLKFAVGGHSKGGNLACYATVFADSKVQKKISGVYLLDSPGFIEDLNDSPGYLRIKDRVHAFGPEGCVIGRLMQGIGDLTPVKAEGKGIYQHDMFFWRTYAGGLEEAEKVSHFSDRLSSKINAWIEAIPAEERKATVDELFGVFEKNGILHINDLTHIDFKKMFGMILSATRLSSENRRLLGIIFREL